MSLKNKIIKPTLEAMIQEGYPYTGFLYFGLMLVNGEPYVIEYNVRLGDPETQAIIPRIKSDLLDLCLSINTQADFKNKIIEIHKSVATTVILTSGGYPEKYKKGYPVSGLQDIEKSFVFHAGLKLNKKKYLTNGGRVIAVTALGKDINQAKKEAYKNVRKITFQNMYFRKDIGTDLIK